MSPPRRPVGTTYRVQVQQLTLAELRARLDYLRALGVDTVYLSPVGRARPGSTHGYDVVDATVVDPAVGSEAELTGLLDDCRAREMGVLLDIVPNHMAASEHNRWWADVLRHGPGSPHAAVFDVDWGAHGGRVLVPILGDPLEVVLAEGQLRVGEADGAPAVWYFDRHLPLRPDGPQSADGPAALAALVAAQHWRLAHWRLSRHQVNYRRFFDVDDLVGVRVERPEVFEATHRLVLALAAHPALVGVRVDHVDGLADPAAYLRRLRGALDAAAGDGPAPVVVVEKILERGEPLRAGWPVEGTTGYEFCDLAGGLAVDPDGAAAMAAAGAAAGGPADFGRLAVDCRREVMAALFPGLVASVSADLWRAAGGERPGRDLAEGDVRAATVELTAHLGVYRTYLDGRGLHPDDRAVLERAGRAARASGRLDPGGQRALDEVAAVAAAAAEGAQPALAAVVRWQQLSGAVAAKGVEDTACYRVAGSQAGAEVGGDPGHPALAPDRFHAAMAARRRHWPGSLNALTTHDTKRSEDVRARLAALSELPERWERAVSAMVRRLGPARRGVDELEARFLLQTMLGAWPLTGEPDAEWGSRLRHYAVKAAREAKRRTRWLDPDPGHERALERLVEAARTDDRVRAELARLSRAVGPAGATNALAARVLAHTAPGVGDVYQGCEWWALSLVDPDNRRPVDYDRLAGELAAVAAGSPRRWMAQWTDGRLKLAVTAGVLAERRAQGELWRAGSYQPLTASRAGRHHLVAFARRHRGRVVVAVVPRLVIGLVGPGRFALGEAAWGSARLPVPDQPAWRDVVTGAVHRRRGGSLAVADILGELPVAVLVGEARR